MRGSLRTGTVGAAVVLLGLLMAGVVSARDSGYAADDIKKYCGTKDLKIALVDGFGGNSWRKITLAEFRDEAAKCPNIKEVAYTDSNLDTQKYTAAINSYVAQGFDVIVTYDDYGSATLGALRNAYKAGVQVVANIANPGGKPGVDYTAFVDIDHIQGGAKWATWLNKTLKGNGNVIMLGGVPGNPSSLEYLKGFTGKAKSYPGLKLLQQKPVDTNWDGAKAQQAVAGLLSKYPKIDGYFSDYGVVVKGAIRAYLNAKKPLPPFAVLATDNELGCLWRKHSKAHPKFQLYALDGTTRTVRIALRKGVAAANGMKNNEPNVFKMSVSMDTLGGIKPKCDPSLPPDADLSSSLTKAQLKALFK